uniref:non-ribosomal peptide synthetase n=1 Tax=Chryseobacterium lactis TaxID=1241981 RepID=UPI0021A3D553|nr:non-ribosomal peptide synthetase [Chryseobacterium lactis]
MANYLVKTYTIQPDDLIPLCFERSEEMLVGILAVLKSGGAYVPMDPSYPADRIKHILKDTGAKIILTDAVSKAGVAEVCEESISMIVLNSPELATILEEHSTQNPITQVNSSHLAYVIYTSGTTGMPKGVMQEHRNVARLFSATDHWYHFNEGDVWSLFHSYVFDFSVWEIWGALFYGGKLLIPSYEQTKDTNLFFSLCLQEGLTVLNQTPTAFYQFIDTALQREEQLTTLRYVIFGGEALNLASLKPWYERYQFSPDLINMYGITETTVHVTYKKLSVKDLDKASLIGENIPDQGMYILDKHLRAVPVGAVGELYVGGAGIARGYLNRAELTAERFIGNPFQTLEEIKENKNGILYKTGDLVRYLADGELEYIGRNDFQVKIRGYRIELGEIENRLQEYSEVKQGVVLAKENKAGMKYLVGYYVSENQIDTNQLAIFLSETLPEYMVPAVFVHLTRLPLTINGKLDRRALPEPEFTGSKEYTAPENELQEKLCQIYGEVLGLDASGIGIHEDFFRLGGNSIMAIKLISTIKRVLNIQVGVATVFGHKTIVSLSHALNDKNNIDEEVAIIPIKVSTPEEQRLSFAQERLWFIETYEGGSSAYNIPMAVRLDEKTNISVISKALETIVIRHEVLRTIIRSTDEGKGYQLVLDRVPEIRLHQVNSKEELEKEINRISNKTFRLDEELPIEINIFRLGDHHHLSVVIHHIAFDGWSTDIFLQEIQTIYKALIKGETPQLAEVKIQYKDFALWQRNYLSGDRLDHQVGYWKRKLEDFQNLTLPADFKRPAQVSYEGETVHFKLDPAVAQGLRNASKELGVSLYTMMLGGYYLMLSAYSGQDDIVVGSPIANRHHAGLEDIIGFFVNTLALREKVDWRQNYKDFILQISQSVTEAQSHQDLPFEKLVEELGIEQDMSRHPVFQVMFGLQSFGRNSGVEEALFHPFEGNMDYQVAKFDLTTMIDDGEETIQGMFNYAKALFSRETIDSMINSYLYLLEQIFGADKIQLENIRLCDLHLIPAQVRKKVLEEWNDTETDYPSDTTIHHLFEKQVQRTPDHIAVVYGDIKLSYQELNERANRLANYLIETYDLQPDNIVPLCLDRSEQMLIAILAVLKSGAAYVPMDSSYPAERIEHILQDTGAGLILAEESTTQKLQNAEVDILSLNHVNFQAILETMPSENPATKVCPANLAYVIYTSGTTGLPKGVMVEHGNVVNLIHQEAKEFGLISEKVIPKRCLWYANYVFDAHVWELYPSITHGHTIYILDKEKQTELPALQKYIKDHKISIATIPPVLLTKDYILPLEKLVVAGDVTNPQVMLLYKEHGVDLINAYGPTESTVCATLHRYNKDGNPLNIGGPIGNMTIYVLDNNQRPVPVGAAGELYIGGEGIARGYLNRLELTEERFIANPFQTLKQKEKGRNERLYKTGDLVRWLSTGELEYLGRNDFQVKIRGYRIELGEIENTLLTYPKIRQAAVLAKENKAGMKYLAGYYVSDAEIDSTLLSEHLAVSLPEYMVPGAFVHLAALPLTINGKLDRRALPEPNFTGNKEYTAPETEIQKSLVEIYGEVLGIDAKSISIHDDFFRLGGDSIISIQLVSKIKQQLDTRLSVKEIFSSRTVAALALLMESKESSTGIEILTEQGQLTGLVPLLPIQEWFFSEKERGYLADSNHWNQSFLIHVPDLDRDLLEKSITLLIEKHDAFRMYYPLENGVLNQQYGGVNPTVNINYLDASGMSGEELSNTLTTWQQQFDIEESPLYCIGYITGYQDKSARIFFAFHHLIIDTVSWRIIVDDLKNIYKTLEKGEDFKIPQKGSSYRQWIKAIKSYKSDDAESRHKELIYWNKTTEQVGESNSHLEVLSGSEYNHSNLILDKNYTEQLIRGSHHVYHTRINDLLLSALALALTEFTGKSRHAVVLESHGREDVFGNMDITETVGWFTSMYPIVLEKKENLNQTIISTKETLRSIPENGIGYGGLIGYISHELPKISFNYLGQLDQEDLSGEKTWYIAAEDSGVAIGNNNRNSHIIGINGAIIDGQLRFDISAYLSQKQVGDLAKCFKNQIIAIIEELSQSARSFLTPSDIGYITGHKQLTYIQDFGEIEKVYLANSLQEGFVYHALNQGDTDDAYRVQLLWDYLSEINGDVMKQAWSYTQQQFPALRLRFDWNGEIIQVIDKAGILDWRYLDLCEMMEIEQEELIRETTQNDRFEVYDLSKGGLFRIYLFKRSEKHYTCLFSNHHAVLDGWSMPVILTRIHEIYLKLMKKEKLTLVTDHAYTNTQHYLQQHKEESRVFWKDYMKLLEDREDLSSLIKESHRHIDLGTYRQVREHRFVKMIIAEEEYQQLKKFTLENGFTINAVLQYLWHSQLSLYGGVQTTVVGTTVSGRSLPIDDIEASAGLFINTLPLIVQHNDGKVVDVISDIQQRISELNTHSDVSLGELHQDARRIFSSLFVYENYPVPKGGDDNNELGFVFRDSVEKLDYPLGIMAFEQGESVTMKINYEGVLFEQHTMEQMIEGMKTVLHQILKNWKVNADQLSYVSESQLNQMLLWNATESDYPSHKTIHTLFEEQVERTPDEIVLVYQDTKLTYRELNEKSNRLAHYLIKTYDLQPDNLVPLLLDRSEHMLVAILAVLKAGAAYVPMDPSYPIERIEHILKDTQGKLIIGQENTIEKLQMLNADVISIDNAVFQVITRRMSSENPVTEVTSDHLAYVIFTSGTTGLPKGVMIDHRNVSNLIEQEAKEFGLFHNEEIPFQQKNCLWYASYVFDAHVWELYPAITHGHRIYLLEQEKRIDLSALQEYIKENTISIATIPPVLLASDCILPLEKLVVAGDITNPQIMSLYKESGVDLINAYGPTESTVCATLHHYNEDGNPLNIGKAIGNMTVYVLDRHQRPVPVGAVGELYIGGAGIARGYLNRPDLTKERFIVNHFQTFKQKENDDNGKLYKTGDLVRMLSNGELEYIGRNDFQVKIRGYRIELGEIENTLQSYPEIRQAAVLAKENKYGLKYLAGYYVSDPVIDPGLIAEFLSASLPEYMVPEAFVHLKALPLTINGKLDRRALPEPDFKGNKEYTAPGSDLEAVLCRIYSEVLKLDPDNISIHDDFFRLGGNSIMAIKLISKIKQDLNIQVSVAVVFNHKTIASLAGILKDKNHFEEQINIVPIQVSAEDQQLLSFAQERLWFIESYEGGSTAYNIPITTILNENIQLDLLQQSLETVIMRHEVLRSMIRTNEKGVGYQVVTDQIPEFNIIKVESRPELENAINRSVNQIFRLDQEIPVKINVFKFENRYYLSVVIHHIAFDGWSTDIFLQEVATIYDRLSGKEAPELPELKFQYKDFALWQRNYLTGDRLDQQIKYWKNKFDNFENLDLPADFQRPPQISYEGENLYFSLNKEQGEKLRSLSKDLGVSLYTVMLSGYYLMLSAYSGQDDIVVGSPVANRHHAGLENSIGFFVNTLALREKINPVQTIREFIVQVSTSGTEAQAHQDLPFEKLVDELGVEQDTSRHPVFQVMFGLQNVEGETKDHGEILFYPFDGELDYQVAKFDLTTMVDDDGKGINVMFNYAKSLFRKETVIRMADSYQLFLDQMIQGNAAGSMTLISEKETQQIINDWNNTQQEYPKELTIHQLFESQTKTTPDQTALVYLDTKLSYRELNERANRLANYLIEKYNLQPDDLVPICLERSENILVAMLAILKSGAAYVPMDPSYPSDRIQHILTDTSARIVLAQKGSVDKIGTENVEVLSLDDVNLKAALEIEASYNPVTKVHSRNLAYVIYTSGTTGLPKGVMIEHSGVINLIGSMINAHRLQEYNEVGCYSNYVFDAFVYEAFSALCNGNTLWLYSNEIRTSVNDLNDYIKENKIEVSFIPPVLLREVVESGTSLKLIFAGGESFPALRKKIENIILINEYGPTEGTVCTTLHHYKDDQNPLNIGAPIANMTTYVLDHYLRPVPVGAVGELYIGGAGVARGYLNRPELTEERFISNPFQTVKGGNARLYKTGDLVRWLPNGELEYVGRNDFQVKIRGHRIELGEIENTLLNYPDVRQVAVLVQENKSGLKYLAGYYVSDKEIEPGLLSEHLSASLPEYMVPGAFVHLTSLPLTINGKLDRRALPEPDFTGNKEYAAPETELQKKLCRIYGEVLGLDTETIGIYDDFFRLGGDSIISIQLVGRTRQQLEVKLSVKEVFTSRTVASLALAIEEKKDNSETHILTEQGILTGEVPFLPVQEWFFSQKEQGYLKDFNHWNQAFLIHVPQLNPEYLERAIQLLVERHDAFRLYYPKTEGRYGQEYRENTSYQEISFLDISGADQEAISQQLTKWQNNFNIENGPLYHIGYINGYPDGSSRIFFALHHLIIDAVSWRIITEDLKNMYRSVENGEIENIRSHSKGSSYRQWVNAVKSYKSEDKESREKEIAYWNAITDIVEENNSLLTSLSGSESHHGHFILDKETTEKLIRKTHHVYQTQINDLLLSALSSALTDLNGNTKHAILLESHGREEVFGNLDITETVGWFTTMYPLLLETGEDAKDTLIFTKESLRNIPDNGIGYGSLIGYVDRSLPKISFNYLGQLDQEETKGEKTWFIAAEDCGSGVGSNNRDGHLISINGAVVDGQLRFGISGYLSESQVLMLSEDFKKHIVAITNYLSEETRSYLTPSDVDHIVDNDQLQHIQESGEIEGVYLANSLQEGFVYHALNQGEKDDAYRVQLMWDYHTEINLEHLQKSWRLTQDHYPSLRLRFDWNGEIVQIIDKEGRVDWRYKDISHLNEEEQEALMTEVTAQDRFEIYDLSKGSLFRIYLFKRNEKQYSCLFSNHHAILDGWSMPVILNGVHDTYLNLIRNQAPNLIKDEAYPVSQKYLQKHKESSRTFWNQYMNLLENHENLGNLVKEEQKQIDLSNYRHIKDHQVLQMSITGNQYHQLKSLTQEHGFTINAVLQYLWHQQLSIYNRTGNTVVGTTVSGRSLPVDGIESSAGLYINTLPLIVTHKEGKVVDQITEIQETISDLNTHSDINLAELHHGGRRIFSSLFVYENYPVPKGGDSNELGFVFRDSVEKLDYPLGIMASEQGDKVILKINYEGDLFESDMIEQLIQGMSFVLNQIVENRKITSEEIIYVSENQFILMRNWDKSSGYILDDSYRLLPVGAVGELYLSEEDYLNQADIKLEYFIINPFQTAEEKNEGRKSKLYKTGDLARYLPDGNIQNMGNADLQMEINGKSLDEHELTEDREYVAGENELQRKLSHIYGEVLGIAPETISIHDDFFRLGGNSIMAIKLISKIKQKLDAHVNVGMVFNHKTIASMANAMGEENIEQIVINPVKVDSPEKQRLSFAQERLWFIESYEGGSKAYNIPMTVLLDKESDISLLSTAFEAIIMRHEVLRTMIHTTENGVGYQVVTDVVPEFSIIDVETKEELEESINKCANKVFRLNEEIPVSITIFRLGDERYLSAVIHHIAFDGWSIDLFMQEVTIIYDALVKGYMPKLPELKIQYKDFALWQRNYLTGERLDRQIEYWKTRFDEYQSLNLPLDFHRPAEISYEGETINFNLSGDLAEILKEVSQNLGVSLYSVMLSGYYLMLSAYSGQGDIVVGSPIANRHHAGLENMVGFFVNTLALREKIDTKQSIRDFIMQVSNSVTEAQLHQDLPFEKLVEELEVEQDTSRHPVFQVMFGIQSAGKSKSSAHENLTIFHSYDGEVNYQAAKFDLTTMVNESPEGILLTFNYAKSLFRKETIIRMSDSYQLLLSQMVQSGVLESENTVIGDLSLISGEESKQIISTWNATNKEYQLEMTIHALFEDQVLKTPEDTALVYQNIRLSYRELNEKSNRLANYLIKTYQLQPDDLVPLCFERSENMLIAMLGVLKAGAAYVPMDPSYPADRIKYILEDTKAKIVLTELSTGNTIRETEVIFLDEIKEALETSDPKNPVTEARSENLAYVIYTSGTTGQPKGVMIEHKGVINLIESMTEAHRLDEYKQVGCFSNYVFDAFVYEAFPALCKGNTLWLYSNDLRTSVAELNEYINENKIEVSFIPPVLLREVIDHGTNLKLIYAGGESFPALDKNIENITLINEYGPTEGTVCATLHYFKEDRNPLNIGTAISNTTLYVLDGDQRAVPVGAIGELYIGGAGIARGYLNREDLTEERFITNPYQTLEQKERGENGRLYKTGDLVRWLQNGELEYIGRQDFQVKIRGYRIELGEIENTLLSYPDIRQAAVVAKENTTGMKYLVGYYAADPMIDPQLLSDFLMRSLPDYMIPNIFVHLDRLPVTINGKLDRKQLPEPEFTSITEYAAPENALQKQLAEIYGEVLGLDSGNISIHDDFFRLGGNSIMVIKLISRIKMVLDVQIKILDIFKEKTIHKLSLIIARQGKEYKAISILGSMNNNPNIFLIHPGNGGSEVYQSLAEQLKINYDCYGVDSYNLYHEEKIDDLNSLASYYLDHIDLIQQETKQEEYILLGWSLGGNIALEIASQLESRGQQKITVYLLDTILYASDQKLVDFLSFPTDEELSNRLDVPVGDSHFVSTKKFMSAEFAIAKAPVSNTLHSTKVVLLKAMLSGEPFNEAFNDYMKISTYNNVDSIIDNKELLSVYPIEATHQLMLEKEEQIMDIINKTTVEH